MYLFKTEHNWRKIVCHEIKQKPRDAVLMEYPITVFGLPLTVWDVGHIHRHYQQCGEARYHNCISVECRRKWGNPDTWKTCKQPPLQSRGRTWTHNPSDVRLEGSTMSHNAIHFTLGLISSPGGASPGGPEAPPTTTTTPPHPTPSQVKPGYTSVLFHHLRTCFYCQLI